jgi:hypothetical protein
MMGMRRSSEHNSHVVLAILLLLAAAGCLGSGMPPAQPDSKPAAETEQSVSERVELRVRASSVVPGTRLTLTFVSVRDDSRCPTGVTCIWEGDAIVRLRAELAGEAPAQLELHTNSRFSQEGTVGALTVTLVSLDPYPEVDKPIAQDAYSATLQIRSK